MLLILFLLLLCAPLQFRLELAGRESVAGYAHIRLWGLGGRLPFRVEGGQLLLPGHAPHPMRAKPDQVKRFLTLTGTFLRSDHARRLIRTQVHVQELRFLLRLGGQDAARTAWITGALRNLTRLIPRSWHASFQVQPLFFSEEKAWRLRCILFTRLGILILIAAMLWVAWKQEQRAAKEEEA